MTLYSQYLDKNKDNLLHPFVISFPNNNICSNDYEILVIDPEKIFITTPALFVWVDKGIQELTPMTTPPNYLTFVHSEIYTNPILEFKDIEEDYTHIFVFYKHSVTEDLYENESELLSIMVPTIRREFSGDLQ